MSVDSVSEPALSRTDGARVAVAIDFHSVSMRNFVYFYLIVQFGVDVIFLLMHLRVQLQGLTKPPAMKSILVWNSWKRIETGYFAEGSESFERHACEVTRCRIFHNRSALPFEQYDAVLMNMLQIYEGSLPADEGYRRSPHQRYVFLIQESPHTMFLDPLHFRRYFNWTMTYKLDSDIPLVYGRVRRKETAPPSVGEVQRRIRNTHKWSRNNLDGKNKSVAWMVSHCSTHSKRETYVQQLRKYIDVDVYGGCGQLRCPRNETDWISDPQCYTFLASRYKFYLSFENSLCPDYATEKFLEILAHDLIPVVYGAANYTALAPPHSFIDAMQYTPKQLARVLHKVGSSKVLYNEFFWWKEHYTAEAGLPQMARHGFCDLCKKLHQDPSVKIYDGIQRYWNYSQCGEVAAWNAASVEIDRNASAMVIGWKTP